MRKKFGLILLIGVVTCGFFASGINFLLAECGECNVNDSCSIGSLNCVLKPGFTNVWEKKSGGAGWTAGNTTLSFKYCDYSDATIGCPVNELICYYVEEFSSSNCNSNSSLGQFEAVIVWCGSPLDVNWN